MGYVLVEFLKLPKCINLFGENSNFHPLVWFGLVYISDTLKPKQYIFIYQFRHQFVSPDSETDMGR